MIRESWGEKREARCIGDFAVELFAAELSLFML